MSASFKLESHEVVTIGGVRSLGRIQTTYQSVEILELPGLGETIFIDGVPQISAADAFMFNETVAHAALCAVDNPKVVFIAGIASGGAVAEALKHGSVERIYAVDIDQQAMEFLAQNLSFSCAALFSDSRVKLIYKDAREYLAECIHDGEIDALIVDVPDPLIGAPSEQLFAAKFYALATKKLNRGGVLLTQSGRYRLGAMSYHAKIRASCRRAFKCVKTYHFYYPCYYEPWSFLLCADRDELFPTGNDIDLLLEKRAICDLQFYSGDTDRAISQIPLASERDVLKCEAETTRP